MGHEAIADADIFLACGLVDTLGGRVGQCGLKVVVGDGLRDGMLIVHLILTVRSIYIIEP